MPKRCAIAICLDGCEPEYLEVAIDEGFEGRTKCLKDIPADIEINEDNSSLDIFPYSPIPSNKDSYAIVFKKIFNPKKSGLKQFHSFGQYTQTDSTSRYLGSWTILIN